MGYSAKAKWSTRLAVGYGLALVSVVASADRATGWIKWLP